jgi:hypothetical protein
MADDRDLSSALTDLPTETRIGQSTLKKTAWRLLPLFALAYGVAIMDRNNIGLAALPMNRGVSGTVEFRGRWSFGDGRSSRHRKGPPCKGWTKGGH